MESFENCKLCGSKLLFQSFNAENKVMNWKCLGCGYTSNSFMFNNSDYVQAFEQTLPKLYVDLKLVDSDGFVWYPSLDKVAGVGIVFANGTSVHNWNWCFAPDVLITEDERDRFNYSLENPYRTDIKNAIYFAKHEYVKAFVKLQK